MSSNFGSKRRNVRPNKFSSKRYYGKRPIILHDFHPDFMNSDGYDQTGMSYRRQYNNQSMNHESVYSLPQPSHVEFPLPPSRSFDELQVERSYLVNSLQREDLKATELLKKIRHLQDACHDVIEGPLQRKLKKQLGHFKNRMCQCTKQEKTILARLGQVTYEIQSKERWSRIENERLQQWNCPGFERMNINETYPESTPQCAYAQQWPVQPTSDSCSRGGNSHPMPMYEAAPEWYTPTIRCDSTEVHELPRVVISPISNRVRSASMVNLALPTEKVKRLSMPELSTGESNGDASNDDEDRYIGYYVSKPVQ
jgi:hypothetical protein